ncbi:MAG TPA: hypothetical protein PLO67_06240 [Saprospiraceae bacterium]|nr:hypothetical protein [Saprospiraceae bacterium]HPI06739.1 hypothetical protein [Saprospiraceae bacterium]
METRTPDNEHPEINALRQALLEAQTAAAKAKSEWSSIYDQHKALREEQRVLLHDYEQLRLQKGGFGFKMLMLAGFMGTVFALAGCFVYLKLKPKDAHTQAFEHFQNKHLIEYQLAITNGQMDAVEQSLREELENSDYREIQPELTFVRQLITTTKRRCK